MKRYGMFFLLMLVVIGTQAEAASVPGRIDAKAFVTWNTDSSSSRTLSYTWLNDVTTTTQALKSGAFAEKSTLQSLPAGYVGLNPLGLTGQAISMFWIDLGTSNARGVLPIQRLPLAKADGATRGATAFSPTNFRATNGVVSLVQDVATTSTPTFQAVTDTTHTVSGATASRAAMFDAGKQIVSSAVTDTELGYVSGTTSNIQAQINAIIGNNGSVLADPYTPTDGTQNIIGNLYLSSTGSTVLTIDGGTTSLPWMVWRLNGTRAAYLQVSGNTGDNNQYMKLASERGPTRFFTGTGGSATEKANIATSGNVNIGGGASDAPSKLNVVGSLNTTGGLYIGGDATTTGTLRLSATGRSTPSSVASTGEIATSTTLRGVAVTASTATATTATVAALRATTATLAALTVANDVQSTAGRVYSIDSAAKFMTAYPRVGKPRSKYFDSGAPNDTIFYLGAGNSGVVRKVFFTGIQRNYVNIAYDTPFTDIWLRVYVDCGNVSDFTNINSQYLVANFPLSMITGLPHDAMVAKVVNTAMIDWAVSNVNEDYFPSFQFRFPIPFSNGIVIQAYDAQENIPARVIYGYVGYELGQLPSGIYKNWRFRAAYSSTQNFSYNQTLTFLNVASGSGALMAMWMNHDAPMVATWVDNNWKFWIDGDSQSGAATYEVSGFEDLLFNAFNARAGTNTNRDFGIISTAASAPGGFAGYTYLIDSSIEWRCGIVGKFPYTYATGDPISNMKILTLYYGE